MQLKYSILYKKILRIIRVGMNLKSPSRAILLRQSRFFTVIFVHDAPKYVLLTQITQFPLPPLKFNKRCRGPQTCVLGQRVARLRLNDGAKLWISFKLCFKTNISYHTYKRNILKRVRRTILFHCVQGYRDLVSAFRASSYYMLSQLGSQKIYQIYCKIGAVSRFLIDPLAITC